MIALCQRFLPTVRRCGNAKDEEASRELLSLHRWVERLAQIQQNSMYLAVRRLYLRDSHLRPFWFTNKQPPGVIIRSKAHSSSSPLNDATRAGVQSFGILNAYAGAVCCPSTLAPYQESVSHRPFPHDLWTRRLLLVVVSGGASRSVSVYYRAQCCSEEA
jgi:hypothetical protein